jgi:two-component system, LytTR family, sensor kinase
MVFSIHTAFVCNCFPVGLRANTVQVAVPKGRSAVTNYTIIGQITDRLLSACVLPQDVETSSERREKAPMILEMKRHCEKCAAALANDSGAYICSFECTFCVDCALYLQNLCPNCGGELVPRPRRNSTVGVSGSDNTRVALKLNSRLVWAASFGVWAFLSLAATAAVYEMYHTHNNAFFLHNILAAQFSTIFTYAPITPFALAFALRYPLQRHNWVRRSLLHLTAGLGFTVLHIALKDMSMYGYWDQQFQEWSSAIWNSHLHAFRNPWIVFKSMFVGSVFDDLSGAYLPIVLIAHIVLYYRRMQDRETRSTQLEAQLTKARLQTLKSQLQPHFLFNTLHSISSLMLTDVAAADRMMTSLSDLLRLSLEDNGLQVTTLDREIEFLDVYLEIEKTRFEDRLRIVFDIAPDCLDAQVPHLLLQPLVENAVRHGISKRPSAGGEIRVTAKREDCNLQILIRDNGPGFMELSDESFKQGLGLGVTRERLLALYGDGQNCEIRNLPENGAEVCLCMPFYQTPQLARHGAITHS